MTTVTEPAPVEAPSTNDQVVHGVCSWCYPEPVRDRPCTALCGVDVTLFTGPEGPGNEVTCVVCRDLTPGHLRDHMREC